MGLLFIQNCLTVICALVLSSAIVSISEEMNENIATAKTWPDFSCHPLFSEIEDHNMNAITKYCFQGQLYRDKATEYKLTTRKGCNLFFLFIIDGEKDTGAFEWQSLENSLFKNFTRNAIANNAIGAEPEVMVRAEQVFDRVMQNMDSCSTVFTQLAIDQKLPDSEWDQLFNCIESAAECTPMPSATTPNINEKHEKPSNA